MNPAKSMTHEVVCWALNTDRILEMVGDREEFQERSFNDDITFCPMDCSMRSCPRNSKNIQDRTIPHSYSVELPEDCPKRS